MRRTTGTVAGTPDPARCGNSKANLRTRAENFDPPTAFTENRVANGTCNTRSPRQHVGRKLPETARRARYLEQLAEWIQRLGERRQLRHCLVLEGMAAKVYFLQASRKILKGSDTFGVQRSKSTPASRSPRQCAAAELRLFAANQGVDDHHANYRLDSTHYCGFFHKPPRCQPTVAGGWTWRRSSVR